MPNEKTIKARVVGVNYGKSLKGETVDVTERELARVGPSVLVSLADEAKARESAAAPTLDRASVEKQQATRAAWRKMRDDGERMIREEQVRMAREVVATGGLAKG